MKRIMVIGKAVIPAAGLGTRLLPVTKEQPKEMLPVFAKDSMGNLCLKPVLQLIFEGLYDAGLREFCFIIGRGKRAIQDHFTPDRSFMEYLHRKRLASSTDLEAFYKRLDDSMISWITQADPRGFGDAVLRVRSEIGDENFMVHAGDACIISQEFRYFKRLTGIFENRNPKAVLLIHEMISPRAKGIADVRSVDKECYEVLSVVEKPEIPKTNFAIEPVYVFRPDFFESLRAVQPGVGGEIQLTDGIQQLIAHGGKVLATRLLGHEIRLDVGDAESYWDALVRSHKIATR